jgi:hypothetical protein
MDGPTPILTFAAGLPLPPIRDAAVFYGAVAVFLAYLLYIIVRRPKAERSGATPPDREL